MTLRFPLLFAIALTFGLVYADSTVLAIALPSIQASYHTTTKALFWVVNSYMLTRTMTVLVAGHFSDKHTHTPIFIFGLCTLILSSLGCALSPNEVALILFRALQGVGATFAFVSGMSIITAYSPPDKKAYYIGHVMSVAFVGMAIGPIIGGILVQYLTWHWIFIVNIILGCVAALIAIPVAKRNTPPLQRVFSLDWPGFVLSALFMLFFTLAFQTDLRFIWPGVISLVILILVEKHAKTPIVDLKLFTSSHFICNSYIGGCAQAGVMFVVFLAVFFQHTLGFSAIISSMLLLPMLGVGVCSSSLGGWVEKKYGTRIALVLSTSFVALGFVITLLISSSISYLKLLPLLILSGLGLFMINGPIRSAMLKDVPVQQHGKINAAFTAARSLISVIAFSITAMLYGYGFRSALFFMGLLAVSNFVLTFIKVE